MFPVPGVIGLLAKIAVALPHNFILVKEARTGSAMIHEYLKSHPNVSIQWEVGPRVDKISAALQCGRASCGCDVWQDTPLHVIESLAIKHSAVIIVLLRYNHFASARSLMAFGGEFTLNEFENMVALFRKSRLRMTHMMTQIRVPTHLIVYEDFVQHRQKALYYLQKHIGLLPMRLTMSRDKRTSKPVTRAQNATLISYLNAHGHTPFLSDDVNAEYNHIVSKSADGGKYVYWHGAVNQSMRYYRP